MTNIYDIYTTNHINEASILNIDDTISEGDGIDTVIDFVRHMLSNGVEVFGKKIDEKYAEELGAYLWKGNIMTFNKGEIIIDSEAYGKYADETFTDDNKRNLSTLAFGLLFSSNGLCINPKKMPKSIKEITYKYVKENEEFAIKLVGDNNFSNVDIQCDSRLSIFAENPSNIKLGKLNCNELQVYGYKNDTLLTGLSLKPGSVINILDLSSRTCAKISKLVGKNLTIYKLKLNSSIVGNILTDMGFATQNTYVELT